MSGTLYIVATPIGNLEDITLRALRVLREADVIACEDTRHTRKLLSHYNISKPVISYHEHNERQRSEELIAKLEAGANIALVSDAGTPLVSDPGFTVVSNAIARGIHVVPIPGPSALAAALTASGLPCDEFMFIGFLPSKQSARRAKLAKLAGIKATLIFYEAPHRVKTTVVDVLEALGDRPAVLARELTKIHEEFLRGSLSEIGRASVERPARGEYVLLIGPQSEGIADKVDDSRTISEEVDRIMREEGLDRKSALKQAARSRGISKSEAYRMLIDEKAEE